MLSFIKICLICIIGINRLKEKFQIEISSKGQNCSILSQNVPKFELYKHNDELFNMYYRTFYELWTFADFDRLCKLEKRGESKWFQTRRFLWEFPIGSYVKLSSAVVTILIGVLKCRTQFWKKREAKNRKKGGRIL
jgi:hypothetical protein